MRKITVFLLTLILLIMAAAPVWAADTATARIKDVAKVNGVRDNQLMGYGLVVGLAGTGDSTRSVYTIQSIANMLKTYGITVSPQQIQAKDVAAVMVTATLPPFVKSGDNIDVTVGALGDARSLQGGVLLQTPLKAGNGQVYAVAQGSLSVGGFIFGAGGSSVQKNFPTAGRIPGGAIVEQDVPMNLTNEAGGVALALNQPDFTTASRIAAAINRDFGNIAVARDPGTVMVAVPAAYGGNVVDFVAAMEELPVTPDSVARVVINERTGTVVIGGTVTIDEVAVSQGGLSVQITRTTDVSQPPPFSNGSTVTTQNTTVNAQEPAANVISLPAMASVADVVRALNAVGATPRDIIAILQAMKTAGALHAELVLS